MVEEKSEMGSGWAAAAGRALRSVHVTIEERWAAAKTHYDCSDYATYCRGSTTIFLCCFAQSLTRRDDRRAQSHSVEEGRVYAAASRKCASLAQHLLCD